MRRILPLVSAFVLVATFGVAEGLWANRWNTSREPELAAARLSRVPLAIGEWEGNARDLDERVIERAGIAGYLMRNYVHRGTGAALNLLLVCGRPGPVAVHTPEVCYEGAGYGLVGAPAPQSVQPASLPNPARFWVGKFQKTASAVPDPLRIHWSWNGGGEWRASDNPRLEFANRPVLFKLYVVRPLAAGDENLENDPTTDFLGLFLPEVQPYLFPAGEAK